MQEKRLFLLDAMALIYRAHFAFIRAPRITSTGMNTSALFGFTNYLLDILRKENPTHLAVAFDVSGPTFRHERFPEYKAHREEVPEDILVAIPYTKKLLQALNIPVLELQGYEADDLIGTLARMAAERAYKVYMVTPDKDYGQLVTDQVFMYKPGRQGNETEIMGPKEVEAAMGVPPEFVVDFLGLKGDAVDNIPGIPKIGDKTAVDLIKTFGTVENIIARAAEITKNSIRETVQQHAEQGLLSKELARIEVNAPVTFDEKHLEIGNPDRDAVIALLNELEFRGTADRLLKSSIFGAPVQVQKDLFGNPIGEPAEPAFSEEPVAESSFAPNYATLETRAHSYRVLETDDEIRWLVKEIEQAGSFCFDTETTGLDALQAELIALTAAIRPHEAYLIYFPHKDPRNAGRLELLRGVLESGTIRKIGQNMKYDMLVLRNYGIQVAGPLFDTMLASYVINADKSHGMDALSRDHLKYDPVSITTLIGKKGKGQLSMRDVPLDKLTDYACEDADITLSLQQTLEPLISPLNAAKVFQEVEMPLVPILTEMEYTGICIDVAALKEYSEELERKMLQIEQSIYEMAGMKFNINSPRQLGEIIFVKMGLSAGKKTSTGQLSTKEEVLVELAQEHELPAKVLEYRKLGKLKSTYVDALPELIQPRTGRIHTTYAQAVAATGRLSSNNPNLQNIPIRTEEGREIRKAFIPAPGYQILSADYSQVELRLMAALSGDPAMIEAFRSGLDVHRATAARVFGVPLEQVDSDMRAKAKMVNFGIIYGISAFGLAQRLKISRTEAKEIIDSYFEKYPRVKGYMDESIQKARELGYAETVTGRRRYLPDIRSQNQTIRGFAERNAINTPLQGSAADLIKRAMIDIFAELKAGNYRSKLLLQVHDELVFEVAEGEEEKLSAMVRTRMENALPFAVPMEVSIGIGHNWLQAH